MKKLSALILVFVLALALTACGKKEEAENDVSVFYYTFDDTYVSTVRENMDEILTSQGLGFTDYDGANSQETQTAQIKEAIEGGTKLLIVNIVNTGDKETAEEVLDLARTANIPIIFFNRSVDEIVVTSYEKACLVITDYEQAGRMQGKLVGEYTADNYNAMDLNGDGVIRYIMLKGQEGNLEAEARTEYGVSDADSVLTEKGLPKLEFYDASNTNLYLVDEAGTWSRSAGKAHMEAALEDYNEVNGNMIELVIANNDEMALGAIDALQARGYNNNDGGTMIPVFGVDAIDAAKEAINSGYMTGTIKQDAEAMASTIVKIGENLSAGTDKFTDVDPNIIVGTWRINIPYKVYTAE